jgi:hypothetical protein
MRSEPTGACGSICLLDVEQTVKYLWTPNTNEQIVNLATSNKCTPCNQVICQISPPAGLQERQHSTANYCDSLLDSLLDDLICPDFRRQPLESGHCNLLLRHLYHVNLISKWVIPTSSLQVPDRSLHKTTTRMGFQLPQSPRLVPP